MSTQFQGTSSVQSRKHYVNLFFTSINGLNWRPQTLLFYFFLFIWRLFNLLKHQICDLLLLFGWYKYNVFCVNRPLSLRFLWVVKKLWKHVSCTMETFSGLETVICFGVNMDTHFKVFFVNTSISKNKQKKVIMFIYRELVESVP